MGRSGVPSQVVQRRSPAGENDDTTPFPVSTNRLDPSVAGVGEAQPTGSRMGGVVQAAISSSLPFTRSSSAAAASMRALRSAGGVALRASRRTSDSARRAASRRSLRAGSSVSRARTAARSASGMVSRRSWVARQRGRPVVASTQTTAVGSAVVHTASAKRAGDACPAPPSGVRQVGVVQAVGGTASA